MLIATPGNKTEFRLKLEGIERGDLLTKRKIKINFKYQESASSPVISGERVIEHIHYKCWVDMSVPNGDAQ
jgi:hypothetical protein